MRLRRSIKSLKLSAVWLGLFTMLSIGGSPVRAVTPGELQTALEQITAPILDSTELIELRSRELEFHDFRLVIDSGQFVPFTPLILDGVPSEWGGLFTGKAEVYFKPGTSLEQQQLFRFYGTDSLKVQVRQLELLLDPHSQAELYALGERQSGQADERFNTAVREDHQFLLSKNGLTILYQYLHALISSPNSKSVVINGSLGKFGQTVYQLNPTLAEEVSLWLNPWEKIAERTLEPVCQYTVFSQGGAATINGLNRDLIQVEKYDLMTDLAVKGEITVEAQLVGAVKLPFQMLRLSGPPEMNLDSVIQSNGLSVKFQTIDSMMNGKTDLWLFFETGVNLNDSLNLMFYLRPKLPHQSMAGYVETEGIDWWPRYGNQPTDIFMRYRTPSAMRLISSGRVAERKTGLIVNTTVEQLRSPAPACFQLSRSIFYDHSDERTAPIRVSFAQSTLADEDYDRDRENKIAKEVANGMALFAHDYGPILFSEVTVNPMPYSSGRVFPGVMAITPSKISPIEEYQADPFALAWRTAGLWWEGAIGYATYHDTWLGEGLRRYSAYRYLQASRGNREMFALLQNDLNIIFNACPQFPSPERECGPVALGERVTRTAAPDTTGSVTERKAAFIMHMLRNLFLNLETMSDDRYLALMREWYRSSQSRAVTTQEFKLLVEKHAGEKMDWFFDQFVYHTYLPTYHFSYELGKNEVGRTSAVCHIRQTGVPEQFKMYVPVEIEFVNGQKVYLRVLVDRLEQEVALPPIDGEVKLLRLNPFHSVLGRVMTDSDQ